jgi:hypothetical protein
MGAESEDEEVEPASQILETVRASFAARRWSHRVIDDPRAVELFHDGAAIPYYSYAQAKEDDQVFVYYSLCPENAPPPRRMAVAAYLTHVSFQLLVGAFEMSWEDGEIRFKTGLDLHGAPLTPELLQGVLLHNHQAMAHYLPNLLKVVRGEQEPPEAYAEASADRD